MGGLTVAGRAAVDEDEPKNDGKDTVRRELVGAVPGEDAACGTGADRVIFFCEFPVLVCVLLLLKFAYLCIWRTCQLYERRVEARTEHIAFCAGLHGYEEGDQH